MNEISIFYKNFSNSWFDHTLSELRNLMLRIWWEERQSQNWHLNYFNSYKCQAGHCIALELKYILHQNNLLWNIKETLDQVTTTTENQFKRWLIHVFSLSCSMMLSFSMVLYMYDYGLTNLMTWPEQECFCWKISYQRCKSFIESSFES